MTERILFVFEGAKTERTITDSFLEHYIERHDRIVVSSYNTDIYSLYQEMKNDDDLDAFAVVLSKHEDLREFSRDSFSQMYLFFDYDGHAPLASDDKIIELLSFFNEETDKGKLFISFPMVESLKCIRDVGNLQEFCEHTYDISLGARFKNFVPTYAHNSLIHFNLYSREMWNDVIRLHCIKANHITSGSMTFPLSRIDQSYIFEQQKIKFINPLSQIATLSSFPLLLLDFLGHDRLYREVSGEVIRDEVY